MLQALFCKLGLLEGPLSVRYFYHTRGDQVKKFTSENNSSGPHRSQPPGPRRPRTCFQGHAVAGQAAPGLGLGHRGDGEHGATGQARQGAGLPRAAAPVQPVLAPGGHCVGRTVVTGSPVHVDQGGGVLRNTYFRTARS